jgi:predicted Zn finger-like uncharacterized protein
MQIVCPNCQTSYGVTLAALGAAGRNVRCAKCKQVWHARPEEALQPQVATPAEPAEATETRDEPAQQTAESWSEAEAPHVDSPSLAPGGSAEAESAWSAEVRRSGVADGDDRPPKRRMSFKPGRLSLPRLHLSLSTGIAAMAGLIAALIVWRTDVVRLLPQTAAFFKLAGISVNLRNLTIDDVHVSTETVNGAPVTVIEGSVSTTGFKPVDIPRLRFVVRDASGTPVYAWNTVLERTTANPGDKVPFKSRLASPPPNAHDLIVRFFNKRDIGS